jgi:predicted AAA+ superfamily ATPase
MRNKKEKKKRMYDKKVNSFLSRVLYANKRVTKHMNAQETREIRGEMMKLILHQNQLTLP